MSVKAEDYDFVKDAWLKSFRNSYEGVFQLEKNYNNFYSKIINGILERPNIKIHVDRDEKFINGYIVWEGTTLHYFYVRRSKRNKGLGKRLLVKFIDSNPRKDKKDLYCVTFLTGHFIKMMHKMDFKLEEVFYYDPFSRFLK